jgi:hypothetical protein
MYVGASGGIDATRGTRRRIIPTPIYHRGAFTSLLRTVEDAQGCFRYRGRWWRPVLEGRRCSICLPAPDYLASLRQRVESYEFSFYRLLAIGHVGRDGVLRPRTRLRRTPAGAYQPSSALAAPAAVQLPRDRDSSL